MSSESSPDFEQQSYDASVLNLKVSKLREYILHKDIRFKLRCISKIIKEITKILRNLTKDNIRIASKQLIKCKIFELIDKLVHSTRNINIICQCFVLGDYIGTYTKHDKDIAFTSTHVCLYIDKRELIS